MNMMSLQSVFDHYTRSRSNGARGGDRPFHCIGNCASIGGEYAGTAIQLMKQRSADITRATFLKHCDLAGLDKELGYEKHPARGLTMAADFHIGYAKSTYRGVPCYYFTWSGFEYIFVDRQPDTDFDDLADDER